MSRRDCLRVMFATTASTALILSFPFCVRRSAAQNVAPMDSAYRSKLIALLRKRGVRSGLNARIGLLFGIYNRGQNLLVARMSTQKGDAILTFGRIVMRNRELYYWGLQPDANVLTTYFFLTDWEFKLMARGVELIDDTAAALPHDRTIALFSQAIKEWITVLDTL